MRNALMFPVRVIIAMCALAFLFLKVAAGLTVIVGCGYASAFAGYGVVYACTFGATPGLAVFAMVPCFALGALGAVVVMDGPSRGTTVIRGKSMKGLVKEDV